MASDRPRNLLILRAHFRFGRLSESARRKSLSASLRDYEAPDFAELNILCRKRSSRISTWLRLEKIMQNASTSCPRES